MSSLTQFVCSVLLLGAPFDPAPPRVEPDGIELGRCCDRCEKCRTLELRFERTQETILRLSIEIESLQRKLGDLERKAKTPAKRPGDIYAPGVKWEPNTYYEKGRDGLLYYLHKEPRAPRYRMVPVIVDEP